MKIHKKILLILSMTIISFSVANAQITDLEKKILNAVLEKELP